MSPPRSEHGDDVSVLFQVLGLALPDPLGLVAERSGEHLLCLWRERRDGGGWTKAAASLR